MSATAWSPSRAWSTRFASSLTLFARFHTSCREMRVSTQAMVPFMWRILMPRYFAVLTIVLMLGMVLTRAWLLKRKGIEAVNFGKIDKTDFIIPPFALFYFYLVFAAAFSLPTVSTQEFFHSAAISWAGALFCLAGLLLLLWSLVSFGQSFRVGIDEDRPDKLVTNGSFALSRNPIYVAFALILLGQFLIFSNWILLVYIGAATLLFHRQVLREEVYLKQHYGQAYADYCSRVRRYF
jgi:protein-S-isoprenylcysteine O-methyltransferase Ste14